MIHVYKYGGDWRTDKGIEYTIKPINSNQIDEYLSSGWVQSLDEVKKPRAKKATKNDNEG